jgi:hypothetical protein
LNSSRAASSGEFKFKYRRSLQSRSEKSYILDNGETIGFNKFSVKKKISAIMRDPFMSMKKIY